MKKFIQAGTEVNSMEAAASHETSPGAVNAGANVTAPGESRYDSLILGDGPAGTYSMDPQESPVNNNVMVIAGTGGGKTKSVVEANLLHAQHQEATASRS